VSQRSREEHGRWIKSSEIGLAMGKVSRIDCAKGRAVRRALTLLLESAMSRGSAMTACSRCIHPLSRPHVGLSAFQCIDTRAVRTESWAPAAAICSPARSFTLQARLIKE
jgi:hypothetical protein